MTVTTPGGASNGATFAYLAVPVVSSIGPAQGPSTGGNTVTITGAGFTGVSAVLFGAASASFTVVSGTQIAATAPAGSGSVSLTVTTPGGTSSGVTYSYVAAPVVSALSPAQGPSTGGNTVTITGTGFTGATGVSFGSVFAPFTVVSSTQITATAPAAPVAPVEVTVVTPGGTSNGVLYYYLPLPTVAVVAPATGPVVGGNTVTITGTGLTLATAVHFGAGAATAVTVVSDNQITAHAPSGTGTVTVTVTTPGGTSLPGAGNPSYTYVALPVISALSPSQGPASGGAAVTITGSDLGLTKTVLFGAIAAPFVAISDTELVATNPGGAPGPVAVTASGPGGVSNTATYQLLAGPSV
ncbi:IPT/TIG domain-containing protein [Actinospica durhamensis]|uniref:IPT/TIG domain-containing protein n=1 Tax=Actinospica durhamensis TaxID=1508375 RepID=UPI003F6882A0